MIATGQDRAHVLKRRCTMVLRRYDECRRTTCERIEIRGNQRVFSRMPLGSTAAYLMQRADPSISRVDKQPKIASVNLPWCVRSALMSENAEGRFAKLPSSRLAV
jgi:hypothetical protein